MSGCRKTSAIGTSAYPIADSGPAGELIERPRSARKPAITRTNSTLPNSDGWNLKNPTSIHRFEPRVAAPAASTNTITASVPK